MKRPIVGLVVVLALSIGVTAQAQSSKKGQATTQSQANAIPRLPSACSYCFTCGGLWPIYSGDIPVPGSNAFERGSRCSGDLRESTDDDPYLCCRANLL